MRELDLRLPAGSARSVRVRAGPGALVVLVEDLAERARGGRAVVVSDSNVAPRHGEPLCRQLRSRGLEASLLGFPAGEASKTRETKSLLEDRLFDLGADRQTVLVALGGGVTGDLVGFVAATWHRGVPVVQAPTSLLAMVDAAIGGKTAVDLPGGKNLVGAFHQPIGVYADTSVLSTLPRAEFLSGFAEVVKAAVIADSGLFRRLEVLATALLRMEPDALEEVIVACIRIKGRVVSRDEHESGRRAVLNFGHTVGHALEAASGYRLAHGRAVALGMVVEGRLAARLTRFPDRHVHRLEALLTRFDLDPRWPEGLPVDAVAEAMKRDKKNRAGTVRCSLPARIGRMLPGDEVTVGVDHALLLRTLLDAAARPPGREV